MANVTALRLEKVAPILERYREELKSNHCFDASELEREIRETLDFGYQSIKTFMPGLCKYPEHLHVAVYFMQNMNSTGPSSQHKHAIAKAIGVRAYGSKELEEAEQSFWSKFFAS